MPDVLSTVIEYERHKIKLENNTAVGLPLIDICIVNIQKAIEQNYTNQEVKSEQSFHKKFYFEQNSELAANRTKWRTIL